MLDSDAARRPLTQIIAECRVERASYFKHKDTEVPSPACVEVFRRAFAGDQDAWNALEETFKPLLLSWANSEQDLDIDAIIQAAWLAFFKSAPKSSTLVSTNQLGPVLAYMRRCVKTALLDYIRGQSPLAPIDHQLLADSHSHQQTDFNLSVRECIKGFLESCSDEERLVFFLRFQLGFKPQEIAANHPQRFATAAAVSMIVQRLTRRLRKDPCLRDLYDTDDSSGQIDGPGPSLAMTMLNSHEREGNSMESSCMLGEEVLLDYILGHASAETRAAVEASPACKVAAEQLAAFILPLMPVLYRLECPDSTSLVEYQEGLIRGTQQLILRSHIQRCPLCAEEIALLEKMDSADASAANKPAWLPRLATLRSAVMQGLRGPDQVYEIDDYMIFLKVREAAAQELLWSLTGRIQHQTQPTISIRRIQLLPTSAYQPDIRESAIDTEGSEASFSFTDLAAGAYTLIAQLDEGEMMVSDIRIGEQDL